MNAESAIFTGKALLPMTGDIKMALKGVIIDMLEAYHNASPADLKVRIATYEKIRPDCNTAIETHSQIPIFCLFRITLLITISKQHPLITIENGNMTNEANTANVA